jgi:purine-nucleoside phosphorylase
MSTPHNQANKGEIAKVVLMCGAPLRAKFIAENFLENYKLVNSVRNMYCYTGFYKGKQVSVAGSGMGIPSIGIYSYELYHDYDVDTIIRVGTAGSYKEEVKIGDIVLALGASSDSNYASQFNLNGTFSAIASYDLLEKGVDVCKENNFSYHVSNVFSSDIFYREDKEEWKKWAQLGCVAVEMESYGLYINAARANKKALTVLSISDSFITKEATSPETRQIGFTNMMKLALEIASEQ